ncbi:MAG: serine/threonine protein kinase, partial [Planctomycetales bacterium]
VAAMDHPHIIQALDAGTHGQRHYLVLEFVEGRDLYEVVKIDGPLPWKTAVDYVIQAAEGLGYAHRHGVIHRDVKPSNLILDERNVVKILDLGLARVERGGAGTRHGETQAKLTGDNSMLGTPKYMAPEQAKQTKDADARADVYGLGCSLHYLLTARAPFQGTNYIEMVLAHNTQPPPSLRASNPEIPRALDTVFQRMLAKDRDDRQQTMEDVVFDLQRLFVRRGAAPAVEVSLSPELQGYVDSLVHAGLFSQDEMRNFLGGLAPSWRPTEPRRLVESLNLARQLTGYQAAMLKSGKLKELVFDRHVVLDQLSRPKQSTLYLVRPKAGRSRRVLKTLPPDVVAQQGIDRFHQAAKELAGLKHPRLVQAEESGARGDLPYLVSEYIPGSSLAIEAKREKGLSLEDAADCVAQAAAALEFAHSRGLLHLNLKPSKLLVNPDGEIQLADVGVARFRYPPLNLAQRGGESGRWFSQGELLERADYTAPEYAMDERAADLRSDIYSLGCVFFYALTGTTLYGGDNPFEVIRAHCADRIPLVRTIVTHVPLALQDVLETMLAKHPGDRYASYAELIKELEALSGVVAENQPPDEGNADFWSDIRRRHLEDGSSNSKSDSNPADESSRSSRSRRAPQKSGPRKAESARSEPNKSPRRLRPRDTGSLKQARGTMYVAIVLLGLLAFAAPIPGMELWHKALLGVTVFFCSLAGVSVLFAYLDSDPPPRR